MSNVIRVLNRSIEERGIGIAELSRRVGMTPELLRRSLVGTRNLKADEFVGLCHFLGLDIEDFEPAA